jgi:6-phosphofructokinase 1
VAVAEGALPVQSVKKVRTAENDKQQAKTKEAKKAAKEELLRLEALHANHTMQLAKQLEELTGQETRVTILGHLQRGGAPSAADRLLATRLGSTCADLINDGVYGVMVASRGEGTEPVLLEDVAGKKKLVPKDHPWVLSAKRVGTNLGDE